MADDIVLNSGSGGETMATDKDEGGGKHYQIIKLAHGVLDTFTLVSDTNPLPVDIREALSTAIDVNSGTSGAGTIRVSVATDDTVSIDFGGVAPSLNTGVRDAGTQRVTIATDDVIPLPTGAATSAAQLADGHNVTVDNAAGASAVNIQDGGNVISIDAASLPLPSGAATSANQLAAGHTVTANAGTGDYLSVSGHTANELFKEATAVGGEMDDTTTVVATEGNVSAARITAQRAFHTNLRDVAGTEIATASDPLRTDPTGTTTQPVSAASLPLPSGAATSAAQLPAGHDVTIDNAGAGAAVNIQDGGNDISIDVGGTVLSLATGVRDAGTLRVTVATNDLVPISAASLPLPAGAATSAAQLADGHNVTIDNASGASAVNIQDGGNALSIDIGGTVPALDTGVRGTTVQRVTLATDDLLNVQGEINHDAAANTTQPILLGGEARTTLPTAVANGDLVRLQTDDFGRLVTSPHSPRDLVRKQHTVITAATETTIATAVSATFLDLIGLMISNSAAAEALVEISDSTTGANVLVFDLAAGGGGVALNFSAPIPQTTVNNNWTATVTPASSSIYITAITVDRT